MTRQNKIYILSAISILGVSFYGYRAIKRNQIHALIIDKINSGSVKISNIKANKVLTGNFHKSISSNKAFALLNESSKRATAIKLNDAMIGAGTREAEINSAISGLRDKVAISQVASYYQAKYNISLLAHLQKELREGELQDVVQIINSKPDVRWIN